MKIRKVWESVNVSTVLMLPIFKQYFKKVRVRGQRNTEFPFIQLLIEHGLVNTYLYNKKEARDKPNKIYLLFNRGLVYDKMETTSVAWLSMNEFILSSIRFKELVFMDENYIVYSLELPKSLNRDFKAIYASEYSKVSKEYKEKIDIVQKKFPVTSNMIGYKISEYNIPYCIVTKSGKLKEELVDELKLTEFDTESIELYPKFKKEKETFSIDSIYQNGKSNLELEELKKL